jgi:hypothetical protein
MKRVDAYLSSSGFSKFCCIARDQNILQVTEISDLFLCSFHTDTE